MLGIRNGYQKTVTIWLKSNGHQQGTTLIEIMLAISLSIMIMGELILTTGLCTSTFKNVGASNLVRYSAYSAGRIVEDDLRGATMFEIAGSDRLCINSSGGGNVEYYLNDSQIYRYLTNSNGISRVPIAENISQMHFSPVGNSIGITIRSEYGQQYFLYNSVIYPRALAFSSEE